MPQSFRHRSPPNTNTSRTGVSGGCLPTVIPLALSFLNIARGLGAVAGLVERMLQLRSAVSAVNSAVVRIACRLLMYGFTGSGKRGATRRIAERLGMPRQLADELTWEKRWTRVDQDEKKRRPFVAIAARESWRLHGVSGQSVMFTA